MFPFRSGPVVIGMVHLQPLPGSPRFRGSIGEVVDRARRDVGALATAGFDGFLLENYGDLPFYPDRVPPETVASMAAVLAVLKSEAGPSAVWGVNVLRNDARAAVAVAAAASASFVRVNVHLGSVVTDQGLIGGRAHETMRARARLAPGAALFADVRVKHGDPLRPHSLEDEARDLRDRGLADALLVTGRRTGSPPELEEVERVVEAAGPLPVLVASGVDARNVREFLSSSRGVIVGTSIKRSGRTESPIDPARAGRLVEAARRGQSRARRTRS